MKLARFRISGEGEWEKEWKRLSGWSRTRSGDGAAARPACVRKREGPCLGTGRAKEVCCRCKGEGRTGRVVMVVCRLGVMVVDFHLRRGASCGGDDGLPLRLALSFLRHLWHVNPDCIVRALLEQDCCSWNLKFERRASLKPKRFNQSESGIVFPARKSFNFPSPHSQVPQSRLRGTTTSKA